MDEDVENVAVFVHGAPQVLLLPLDVHEQLVEMPRIPLSTARAAQPPRIDGTESPTPLADSFVGDGDAALGEQILHIPEAEAEAVVEPDGVTDNVGREAVAVIARQVAGHRLTLPRTAST